MFMITLSAMSLAACSFLAYVFLQFYREFQKDRKRLGGNGTRMTAGPREAKPVR